MKKIISLFVIITMVMLSGCSSKKEMKNGFYTAEMSEFSYGWKEYLCIKVQNNQIVYAEFNAKDKSGFIKAWDNAYMKNMGTVSGTYPNEYTRNYVEQLIESQDKDTVDGLSGATSSYNNFQKLSTAVVEQAIKGNPDIVIVESEKE